MKRYSRVGNKLVDFTDRLELAKDITEHNKVYDVLLPGDYVEVNEYDLKQILLVSHSRVWLRDGNSILFRDIKRVWLHELNSMHSYMLDAKGDVIYE